METERPVDVVAYLNPSERVGDEVSFDPDDVNDPASTGTESFGSFVDDVVDVDESEVAFDLGSVDLLGVGVVGIGYDDRW